MRKILERCPTCGSELIVTELRCTSCETVIRARYAPCPFCRLDEETLEFVRDFVRMRGNLKEMAREMNQSYWTLRARLNEVSEHLGFQVLPDEEDTLVVKRREILERLRRGELQVAEAAEALSQLRIPAASRSS